MIFDPDSQYINTNLIQHCIVHVVMHEREKSMILKKFR